MCKVSPDHNSIDVAIVSFIDVVNGLWFGVEILVQGYPALLNDDWLHIGVKKQDEVRHLGKEDLIWLE